MTRQIGILFLWLESFFLISVGLLYRYVLNGQQKTLSSDSVFWALMGVALIGIFTASVLSIQRAKENRALRRKSQELNKPVDLEECFRALKAFGSQNPIFQDSVIQSEAFSLDSRKSLSFRDKPILAHPCRVVIEHWEGPEVFIDDGIRNFMISERNLLKLDVLSKSSLSMSLKRDSSRGLQKATGIIHFIKVSDSGLT
jgi:hypothetical protein